MLGYVGPAIDCFVAVYNGKHWKCQLLGKTWLVNVGVWELKFAKCEWESSMMSVIWLGVA